MEHLLTADHVLCEPGEQTLVHGGVLVRHDTIVAVGPATELAAIAGPRASTRHFAGSTLLPGLVNAHVHLGFDAGMDPAHELTTADDDKVRAAMTARAGELLAAGITTARDLGDRDGLAVAVRDVIAAGNAPGPRLLVATTPLTPPGGHCWFLGGEVDDEASIRTRVRINADAGADVIKVMASGGKTTPGSPAIWQSQFDEPNLRCVVDEAHQLGLPVAAHAHGAEAIALCVAAGVDTVEHCGWRTEGGGIELRDDVADAMAARGITACPTPTQNWRRMGNKVGQERAEQYHHRLSWLHRRGVRLIFGNDAGTRGARFDDIVSSLEVFEHVGLERAAIMQIATANAGAALGLRIGRLRPGWDADLLVVRGDPLTDLQALRNVELVVTRGRLHQPTRSTAAAR